MKPFALAVAAAAVAGAPALAAAQERPSEWREFYRQRGEEFLFPFVETRAGGWMSGSFDLDSVTAHGPLHVSGNALTNLGADIGAWAYDWCFWVSYDAGLSDDVVLSLIGANAGFSMPLPHYGLLGEWETKLLLSVGLLWGDLHIDDFQDFESSFGVRAGAKIYFRIPELAENRLSLELFLDGRFIRFDIDDEVFSGDEEYGGGSFAAGVGLNISM